MRLRLILLVLLAALPLLAVTLFTNAELRRIAADAAQREALRLARIAASDQRDFIQDTRQLLYALAQLPEAQRPDMAPCATLLTGLLAQYPQYALLAIARLDGEAVCATPGAAASTINLTERTAFQKTLQTGDFAVEDFLNDDGGSTVTLDVAYPVRDDEGQMTAVAFASLDLIWLNRLAAEAQLPAGSSLTVIDQRGTVLVRYPEGEAWVGRSLPETPLLDAIYAHGGQGTLETEGLDGEPRLFAFVPLFNVTGEGDLYVSIGIPKDVAFADINRVLRRNMTALVASSCAALAAAWIGSDIVILRQVNRLGDVVGRLGKGDMTTRTHLPYKGELGQLAHAFDEMAESLTQRIAERDRAEAELHENRRALVTLMSNLPGMAYRRRLDAAWSMEFVSQGCRDLTGYEAEALTGGEIAYGDLVVQADHRKARREIREALAAQRAFEVTYRMTSATGEVRWVSDKGRGVLTGDHRLVAIEGFVSDITERAQVQQLLEQRVADRTRELSALYDVMGVLNASMDLETTLNNTLERILSVLSSETGAIHLWDEAAGLLRLTAAAGTDTAPVTEVKLPTGAASAPQETVVRGNVTELTAAEGRTWHPLLDCAAPTDHTYLGVLIRSKDQGLGTLGLLRDARRPFQDEEMSLAQLIADELGVAIENAQLQQQAKQLAIVQERERLARELHDSVTQSLYSLTLLAEAGRQHAQAGGIEPVSAYLERLGEIGQQALKEMRLLVYELRPLALRREGLAGALQHRLDAVEKRAGTRARLLIEHGSPSEWAGLPSDIETALYRIALEALNNSLKHAAGSAVTVVLSLDSNNASLEVIDDGRGFDVDAQRETGGLGLISMRERAEQMGAELTIASVPGQGTKVRVRVLVRWAVA